MHCCIMPFTYKQHANHQGSYVSITDIENNVDETIYCSAVLDILCSHSVVHKLLMGIILFYKGAKLWKIY
jgi:acyl-ACP thioesterase